MADSMVEQENQVNGKIIGETAKEESDKKNDSETKEDDLDTKVMDTDLKVIETNTKEISKDTKIEEKDTEDAGTDAKITPVENKQTKEDEKDSDLKEEIKDSKSEDKDKSISQNEENKIESETEQDTTPEEDVVKEDQIEMEQSAADLDSLNNNETKQKDPKEDAHEEPSQVAEKPTHEKRQRKKVTRFSYDDAPSNTVEKKKIEIPEGKGIPLGEHPRVEMHIQKNRGEDLKIIHKFFYGVFGDALTCKKAIRQFRGFAFEKDSLDYEKKEEYLGKFTLDNLKWALTVCDVEKKGKKEDLIDLLMEWSLCPKPSDKAPPTKQSKKKTGNKRISSSGKESNKKSPGKGDSPSKKRNASSVKSDSPNKKFHFDAEDSETLAIKKRKQPPTNAQLKKAIQKILKNANLEEITMKTVCLKVYANYPDYDLTDRKSFIKETVKKIIS